MSSTRIHIRWLSVCIIYLLYTSLPLLRLVCKKRNDVVVVVVVVAGHEGIGSAEGGEAKWSADDANWVKAVCEAAALVVAAAALVVATLARLICCALAAYLKSNQLWREARPFHRPRCKTCRKVEPRKLKSRRYGERVCGAFRLLCRNKTVTASTSIIIPDQTLSIYTRLETAKRERERE